MPMVTLKVSADLKSRIARAARLRKVSVSEFIRKSLEKDMPAEGRGFLLGRLQESSRGSSTYDPAKPAFEDSDWDNARK